MWLCEQGLLKRDVLKTIELIVIPVGNQEYLNREWRIEGSHHIVCFQTHSMAKSPKMFWSLDSIFFTNKKALLKYLKNKIPMGVSQKQTYEKVWQ